MIGYQKIAADHPVATSVLETGAPVLVGGAVGGILGGPPGAVAGVRIGLQGMVTGKAINLAAGDQIGKVMGAAHDGLARGFARAGDLNSNQASALAGATMFGASLFMDVKTGFAAGNVSSKLPHKTGQPGATSVLFKKSVDDFGIGLKPSARTDAVAGKIGKVEVGADYASSAASHVRYKESLVREGQIAALNSGKYTVIAGHGADTILKDAPRLAATYGGDPSDWSKVASYSHKFDKSGIRIEYHAYKNMRTNQVVETKPKIH